MTPAARRGELEGLQERDDRRRIERLVDHRQHLQPVPLTDTLYMLELGGAAAARELHEAGIAAPAEVRDGFNRVGGFETDIEEHERRRRRPSHRLPEACAVREFLGFKTDAMQDQRQELADARLVIDDKAGRHGRSAACRGGVCRLVAGLRWVPAFQAFGHATGPRLRIRNVVKTLRRTG